MKNTAHLMVALIALSSPELAAQEAPDPYLWLEEVESEAAVEWARVRTDRTRAGLEALPVYDSIRTELSRLVMSRLAPAGGLGDFSIRGEYIDDYWSTHPNSRRTWRRTTVASYLAGEPDWRVLLDVDSLADAEGVPWALNGTFCLYPELKRCMVRLSRGGSDVHVLREFDAERGGFVSGGFSISQERLHEMQWVDANTVLVGTDFRSDRPWPRTARLWRRGTPLEDAEPLLEIAPSSFRVDFLKLGGELLVREWVTEGAARFHLLRGEDVVPLELPPADLRMVSGRLIVQPQTEWHVEDRAYPASAVLAIDWDAFLAGSRDFTVVVAPDDRTVVHDVSSTKSALVVQLLRNVRSQLHEYRVEDGRWIGSRVPAPELGVVGVRSADPHTDTYFFNFESRLQAPTVYVRRDDGNVRPAFAVSNPIDTSGFLIEQLETTSPDGTRVPYFVVRSRDLEFDGANPTLLLGYGGFGTSLLPTYRPVDFPWLERGGVVVIANIRGGGEFGPAWHEAGKREKRQNAYDDFFAVAGDLVRRRITSPGHLGITGRSNGGTLMGVALNQRPDLFGAVHADVPLFDLRRTRAMGGLVRADEWGDPDDPEDWAFMRRYSPYHNVSASAEYPPLLVTTNRRDDRVPVGNARKMTARLEDFGHEVLYYESAGGGHGVARIQQGIDRFAMSLTFFLSRLHPSYAPHREPEIIYESTGDSARNLRTGSEVSAADSAGASARSYWRPLASPDRASARLSRSPDGTFFAGTRAGLFASGDLGRSWHLRGSANRSVGPPLATPEGALLAGSYRQGILRSTDGGRTWTSVGFERNIYTGSLVRDRDGRIYARVRGAVEDEPTGVFRSDDDGRTWTAAGLADEAVYDISIPRPGVLFAGTENGLFRSENGGDTWSPAGELPSGAPVSEVVAHGGDLFAAMGAPLWRIPGGGVARSRDGGGTWEPTEGLPSEAAVQDLAVHGGTLFAAVGDLRHDEGRGLYRLDAGGRWRPSGLDDVRLLSLLSTPDGLSAGARELGVFRSEDGRSWTRRSEGFRNWAVPSLAVGADGSLYGLTARDLFRSADRGRSWTSTPRPEGSAVPTPWSMNISPEGRLLLAGEGGILVSDDGGASWERRPIPGEEGEVFALSAGPGGEVFAVVRGEAAYVSPDEGRSWRRLDLPGAPVRAVFSSPTGARFATTAGGFHRRGGDGSWEEVSGEHVWALTACGEALVAGTYARGLLRSTDDGRSWSPVTEELRARSQQGGYLTFTALACLPDGGVLAGTFWDGVFYSPDAGGTWRDATAGLPAESVQDFAVSPDGRVFVSTPAGVFVNVALPDE